VGIKGIDREGKSCAMSRSAVESLLSDSEDEGLVDLDLSSITLEDILREEELASQTTHESGATAAASDALDDDFFSPATMTLSIAPLPGMEVVPSTNTGADGVRRKSTLDRAKSVTEMGVGGNAGLISAAAMGDKLALRSPLEIAEAREKQLLSCVGVELISPLQVKRRLRATARSKHLTTKRKPESLAKQKSKKKLTLSGVGAAANGDKTNDKSSGVVKVEAMNDISRQLKKNIEFKEHGPGSPTVVAIHSKFIAIGTSKGLVLIFDHFQNVSVFSCGSALCPSMSHVLMFVFRFAKFSGTQPTPTVTGPSRRSTCRQAVTFWCVGTRVAGSSSGI
jgi:hypothetical protein